MTVSKKPAHRSKFLALLAALVWGICDAQADDLATPTPTPTPAYLNPLARRGEVRRLEQSDRRRAARETSQGKAATRAQKRSDRRSTAVTDAQARATARSREQAQREIAAEARRETSHATAHPTSDLMARMGFSADEIAAQKAHETPAKPGMKEPMSTPSPTALKSP